MNKLFQIVRFLASGSIGTLAYFAIFYGLIKLGLWYIVSAIIATIIQMTIKFVLYKFWAFNNKNTDTMVKQVILFFVMVSVIVVINSLWLYIFVEYAQFQLIVSQIVIMPVLSFVSYMFSKRIFIN